MFSDFGDLEIEDNYRDREERMRSAFIKSKTDYAKEQIFHEPMANILSSRQTTLKPLTSLLQWHTPLGTSLKIEANTHHARNIDYSLDDLYIKGSYGDALDLALGQLEVEEANIGKDGREYQLIDFAMRCAIRLGRNELAVHLADRTKPKVSSPCSKYLHTSSSCAQWATSPGLASTSAEAYLSSGDGRSKLAEYQ